MFAAIFNWAFFPSLRISFVCDAWKPSFRMNTIFEPPRIIYAHMYIFSYHGVTNRLRHGERGREDHLQHEPQTVD